MIDSMMESLKDAYVDRHKRQNGAQEADYAQMHFGHEFGWSVFDFEHEDLAGDVAAIPYEDGDTILVGYWIDRDDIEKGTTAESLLEENANDAEIANLDNTLNYSHAFAKPSEELDDRLLVTIAYSKEDYAYGAEEAAELVSQIDPLTPDDEI